MSKTLKFRFSSPIFVIWYITNACDLNCAHCFIDKKSHITDELSTEEAKLLIDQMHDVKVFKLGITGGEPLLREDLFEILNYATSKGIGTTISTNGSNVDLSIAKKLKLSEVKFVQVSLDGASSHSHDKMRGKEGSFKAAIKCIKNLRKVGIKVHLNTVLTKLNVAELLEIADLAIRLEVNELFFENLIPIRQRVLENFDELFLNQEDYNRILRDIYQIRLKTANQLRISFIGGKNIDCSAARASCTILANGKVMPCPIIFDEKYCVGSLREQSLRKIWLKATLSNFWVKTPTYDGKCQQCCFNHLCHTNCNAYKELYCLLK